MDTDIQKAFAAGQLVPGVLQDWGLDHGDRMALMYLMMSGSEQGREAYDTIFAPALEEAKKRVAAESEGTPPQLERE